jgi:hypothetical protein
MAIDTRMKTPLKGMLLGSFCFTCVKTAIEKRATHVRIEGIFLEKRRTHVRVEYIRLCVLGICFYVFADENLKPKFFL